VADILFANRFWSTNCGNVRGTTAGKRRAREICGRDCRASRV